MKNKDDLRNLKKHSETIALSKAEKEAILGSLLNFTETHQNKSIPSPDAYVPKTFFYGQKGVAVEFAAICLVVFILVGGTTYAASYALPGDALYPVKINVNEEVKGFFATDKTAWQLERVQLRLQEAETLAVEGKFDAATNDQVKSTLDANTADVNDQIVALAKNNDVDTASSLATNLETALQANQDVLVQLSDQSTSTVKSQLLNLAANIDGQIATAASSENSLQNRLAMQVSAANATSSQHKLDIAENSLAGATVFVKNASGQSDIPVSQDARNSLAVAQNLIDQGRVKMGAGDYKNAFIDFQSATKASVAAKTFASVSNTTAGSIGTTADADSDASSTASSTSNASASTTVKVAAAMNLNLASSTAVQASTTAGLLDILGK